MTMTYYARKKTPDPLSFITFIRKTAENMAKQYNNSYKTNYPWTIQHLVVWHWLWSLFGVFWSYQQLVSRSIQVPIIALNCPIFVAGDALKGGFIRPHDLFPIINTPVNIFQSKSESFFLMCGVRRVLEAAHRLGICTSFFRRCSIYLMETFPRWSWCIFLLEFWCNKLMIPA